MVLPLVPRPAGLLAPSAGLLAPLTGLLALLAALSLAAAPAAARPRHRHPVRHLVPAEPPGVPLLPPDPVSRAAYQSGFAFGLLDAGISGAPSAISPYAPPPGLGYRRPGYGGPNAGYPGY